MSTAAISGEVVDTSGARMPAVTIKLLNLQTGNASTTTTGPTGDFLIAGILPGLYSMQVQREGFAAIHVSGLTLKVGESREFLIKLRVGAVEQTVEVDASGQSMNTEDAQMTTVVGSLLVHELPLNGQSFQDLIAMTPGALSESPQMPRDGGFSVNGQSTDTNRYWVDGISGNFGSGPLDAEFKLPASGQYASLTALGTTQSLVALDALQEFRVVASTASAEYGSAPGGQFTLLTRQGTQQVHGTAFGYIRNSDFDAADWFGGYNRAVMFPLSSRYYPVFFDQNIVGGALGLPVPLKRGGSTQNASRLFGSYEETHVRQRTAPLVQYLPNGVLIGSSPAPIQNAFAAFYGIGGQPEYSDDPALFGVVDYQPSPPSYLHSIDARFDHDFGARFSGFLRFADTPSENESVNILTSTVAHRSNRSVTFGVDGQLSSNSGNEFRLGWAQSNATSVSSIVPGLYSWPTPPAGTSVIDLPTDLGSPGLLTNTRSVLYMRIDGIGDTVAWTDNASNALRQIEARETASWQRGSHLLRMGVDALNLHSAVKPAPWTIEADYLSGNSVLTNAADFLILRKSEPAHPVFDQFGAFVQDQWRAERSLTLSAGLRWDVNPPPGSSDRRNAFRVEGNPDTPATLSVNPRGTPLWKTDWFAFGPRLGVAWQAVHTPGRELILRGGLGLLYDTPFRAVAPAFADLGFVSTTITRKAAIPNSAPAPSDPAMVSSQTVGYLFPRTLRNPHSLQWNISLEHAAGEDQSVVASYVGAAGHDLLVPQRHLIDSPATPLQEIVTLPSGYTSQYESMQLAYRGQLRTGLSWMTSYVWAHAIDFASVNPWATAFRGNADTDVRHILQAAGSWRLPNAGGNGLSHWILSGWSIDGRYFVRTAYPATVLGKLLHDPITGERFYSGVDLVPGKPLYLYDHALPGRRMLNGGPLISNGAFRLPAGGSQGNAPRNLARGFGAQQVSLSIQKEIPLYRGLNLNLRGDFFNLLNSPDFGYVDANLNDRLFGQPVLLLNQSYGESGSLYQSGGPRSMQWMLRIRW